MTREGIMDADDARMCVGTRTDGFAFPNESLSMFRSSEMVGGMKKKKKKSNSKR
jgi:hypothetical protein